MLLLRRRREYLEVRTDTRARGEVLPRITPTKVSLNGDDPESLDPSTNHRPDRRIGHKRVPFASTLTGGEKPVLMSMCGRTVESVLFDGRRSEDGKYLWLFQDLVLHSVEGEKNRHLPPGGCP